MGLPRPMGDMEIYVCILLSPCRKHVGFAWGLGQKTFRLVSCMAGKKHSTTRLKIDCTRYIVYLPCKQFYPMIYSWFLSWSLPSRKSSGRIPGTWLGWPPLCPRRQRYPAELPPPLVPKRTARCLCLPRQSADCPCPRIRQWCLLWRTLFSSRLDLGEKLW